LQPGAVSVDSVRAAVGRLLSDAAFRSAAMRVSAEIAAMPAPNEVADRLHAEFGGAEGFVESRSHSPER
jgi:UDP:flavonoid glycosyltransferase YjiC (YdhE family)